MYKTITFVLTKLVSFIRFDVSQMYTTVCVQKHFLHLPFKLSMFTTNISKIYFKLFS